MHQVIMEKFVYLTHSQEDTLRFSSSLAEMLDAGDTVLLTGDLGTGKSVVARGIARALGVTGAMPSPTFTILIPYQGRKKVYHFDLYRLSDPDEFYASGLDEFVGGDGIALIEWPQMAELEVQPSLKLSLMRGDTDDERRIEIENAGTAGFRPEALKEWRIKA